MSINITTDYYPVDNTLCITLIKDDSVDLFWIDNPADPEQIKTYVEKIESSINNMTDKFINTVSMIRTGGGDERLDIAYELCDYLARNQKLDERLLV